MMKELSDGIRFYDHDMRKERKLSKSLPNAVGLTLEHGMCTFSMGNGEERRLKIDCLRADGLPDIGRMEKQPSATQLAKVIEKRDTHTKAKDIEKAVAKARNIGVTRRVMVAWHYFHELRVIHQWQEKMGWKKRRLAALLKGLKKRKDDVCVKRALVMFFYGKLVRRLHHWKSKSVLERKRRNKIKSDEKRRLEIADAQEMLSILKLFSHSLQNTARNSIVSFEQAPEVDTLSNMEVISVMELREIAKNKPGKIAVDALKLTIWITNGKTLHTYDTDHTGIIGLESFADAVRDFRAEAWKYDGVLW